MNKTTASPNKAMNKTTASPNKARANTNKSGVGSRVIVVAGAVGMAVFRSSAFSKAEPEANAHGWTANNTFHDQHDVVCTIDRRSLTPAEFREQYFLTGTPVILENARAVPQGVMRSLHKQYFVQKYGQVRVAADRSGTYGRGGRAKNDMNVAELVGRLSTHPERDLYFFDTKEGEFLRQCQETTVRRHCASCPGRLLYDSHRRLLLSVLLAGRDASG
jgi:hypothetical protein